MPHSFFYTLPLDCLVQALVNFHNSVYMHFTKKLLLRYHLNHSQLLSGEPVKLWLKLADVRASITPVLLTEPTTACVHVLKVKRQLCCSLVSSLISVKTIQNKCTIMLFCFLPSEWSSWHLEYAILMRFMYAKQLYYCISLIFSLYLSRWLS